MDALSIVLAFVPVFDLATEKAKAPLAPRIDAAIRRQAENYERDVGTRCGDLEFLRRISLDLAGSIPSSETARAFLADNRPDKRSRLVDQLLASDAYARHMATTFDNLLMDRRPGEHVKVADWQAYLRQSFAANKPLDRLVRELLETDGSDPKSHAPARFLLDRKAEPHIATKDIGRLFLGMNLECCQCHDHPRVEGFKQEHYFGIFAFINRTYAFADKKTKSTVLAEKAEGDVTFESVFKPKVVQRTRPRLPFADEMIEPAFEKGKEFIAPVGKDERGVPKFSRRSRLGGAIVEHPYFSRTITNRVWSWLMGRGIVHPVEYDHDGNPPSHPELLELLASDFRLNRYDLKRLLREIVLTEAYQRSSQANDKVSPDTFLVAAVRPLTPEQFAWSLARATGQIEAEIQGKTTEAAAIEKVASSVQSVAGLFANLPGEPAVNQDFTATLEQSLFLNYGKTLDTWLTPRPGSLTARLAKSADDNALAEELYLSVMVRMPTSEEREMVRQFLNRPGVDRTSAIRDLSWALLTSNEFRFNH